MSNHPTESVLINPTLASANLPNDFLALSFGIEVEFFILYSKTTELIEEFRECGFEETTGPDLNGEENVWNEFMRERVRNHMVDAGIEVFDEEEYEDDCSDYTKWDLTWDESVTPEGIHVGPNQYLASMELVSPALTVNLAAMTHVSEVLNCISQAWSIRTSATCGLHVHLGNSNRLFSTKTIRNLGFVQSVFDRQLNSLHPRFRIDGYWCHTPTKVWAPHCNTRHGRFYWLRNIPHNDVEMDMLIQTLSPNDDKCIAFNYLNLHNHPHGKTTVEIRQHAATLDQESVFAWLDFLTKMVLFAHRTSQEDMETFISRHISKDPANFTALDLMRAMNVSRFTINHYSTRMLPHPDTVDESVVEDYIAIDAELARLEEFSRNKRIVNGALEMEF